jgi:glycerol-3-phosphate dehydrogenase
VVDSISTYPYIEANVIWASRERACTMEDVLSRRPRLAFLNKDAALEAIPKRRQSNVDRARGWNPDGCGQKLCRVRTRVACTGRKLEEERKEITELVCLWLKNSSCQMAFAESAASSTHYQQFFRTCSY